MPVLALLAERSSELLGRRTVIEFGGSYEFDAFDSTKSVASMKNTAE